MRKRRFFFFALCALLSAFSGISSAQEYELSPATLAPNIEFSADSFEYQPSSAEIHLKGNVEIFDSTWTLKAEEVWVEMEPRILRAQNSVSLGDGTSTVKGSNGIFDFVDRKGQIWRAFGGYPPWRFQGRSITIKPDRFIYDRASFTSCTEHKPHYQFTARRLVVVPGRWIRATHSVFYLGPAPVFYFPIYYRSLRPDPFFVTKFRPGYDSETGVQFKTVTSIRSKQDFNEKLYLDYYTKEGLGTGGELAYNGESARGSLYAYHIRERSTKDSRWTLLGNHWQSLGGPYYFQARLQALSEPDFNNVYFRSNNFRVAAELLNSAGIVRQTSRTTTRLSSSRRDTADLIANRFVKAEESLPRLDFRLSPFTFGKSSILHNFDSFAEVALSSSSSGSFYRQAVGALWSASRSIPLGRGVSLTPQAGYQETWEQEISTQTSPGVFSRMTDVWTGRYHGRLDLRLNKYFGDIDFIYFFKSRFKANSFSRDARAFDRGIESHLLTFQNTHRPSRKVWIQFVTGYDLRTASRGGPSLSFEDRLQPLVADVVWTPKSALSLTFREDYHISQGNRSLLFRADFGNPSASHGGFGVSQNKAYPGSIFLQQSAAWVFKDKSWKVWGVLREELSGPRDRWPQGVRLFEKEVNVSRTMHDFVARATLRLRSGVTEFLFNLDLKLPQLKEAIKSKVYDKEWYPWRSEDVEQ